MKFFCYVLIAYASLGFTVSTYSKGFDEYIPQYEIVKNEKDPGLGNKDALFIFHFRNIPLPAKIKGSCNGLQKTINTDSKGEFCLKLVPRKYIFQFYYNEEFFEVYTDSIEIKPGYRMEININFVSSEYPINADKPVIYVYAPESTKVNIELEVKGEITFAYPAYNNGWELKGNPNGNIQMNGRDYKYLFWEGPVNINNAKVHWEEGSLVLKDSLLGFLEKKLTAMGLSSTEQQDFITYWYPLMHKNEHTYVHFICNEEYDEYAHISVSPKPDHMFRVFMLWCNVPDPTSLHLKEQELPSFARNGFTLVEWGGSQLSEVPQRPF